MRSATMPSTERRRKRLVIERDFQFRFALQLCLYGGGLLLVFGGILLFLLKTNYEIFIQEALIQMPDMVGSLKRELRLLSLGIVTGILVILALLFGFALALTRRVAGPLLALKRRLQDFGNGQHGVRLALREADEFHSLQELFNRAMEAHDKRQQKQRDSLLELTKVDNVQELHRRLKQLADASPGK